jgi:hypothetical protein
VRKRLAAIHKNAIGDKLMDRKITCQDCNWRGHESQALVAPNPFSEDEEIMGCPHCKAIGTFDYVCDQLNCWQLVSCGFPTDDGYRSTCGEHMPEINCE